MTVDRAQERRIRRAKAERERYKTPKYGTYVRERNNRNNAKLKIETFEAYGGIRCAHCKDPDIRTLSIDHINNGGYQHRKGIGVGSGMQFYRWLRTNNWPEGFQVLCMSCQFIKRHGPLPPERKDLYERLKVLEWLVCNYNDPVPGQLTIEMYNQSHNEDHKMKIGVHICRTAIIPTDYLRGAVGASQEATPEQVNQAMMADFGPLTPGLKFFISEGKSVATIEAMGFDIFQSDVPFAGMVNANPLDHEALLRLDGALHGELSRMGIDTTPEHYEWRAYAVQEGN